VTNILHDEFKKIFADPELQPTLLALGLTREWVSGSDLVQKIASDTAKWRGFTTAANIHAE
jgi:tripartite-type tricarboxylate transporter receptor subunit TctC